MKISIGSDHAGFKLKEALVAYLAKSIKCSIWVPTATIRSITPIMPLR